MLLDYLFHHMNIHSGKYRCTQCGKCCHTGYELAVHSRPYECPYCGKLFKIHSQLKRHVRIHTDAKPYSCRHCSDCFTWHRQLKTHLLKSHNEGTWFTCDICQKKFSRNGDPKEHVQRHEAVKSYVCNECVQQMN